MNIISATSKNIFTTSHCADATKTGDNNYCTAAALHFCTGMDFLEAQKITLQFGRILKKGMPIYKIADMLRNASRYGHQFFVCTNYTWMNEPLTVNQFIKENPIGTFYVTIRSHAFCIQNGKIVDHISNPKFKSKIDFVAKCVSSTKVFVPVNTQPAPQADQNVYGKLTIKEFTQLKDVQLDRKSVSRNIYVCKKNIKNPDITEENKNKFKQILKALRKVNYFLKRNRIDEATAAFEKLKSQI
jgi:hypothetical protein